ncbi:MAG: response regulator [Flavobacteriaceae bacterium]|nr:response regulator [Flavobacteriaceae bacterium]
MSSKKSHHIIAIIDRYLADPRLDSETLLRKRWTWLFMMVNFLGCTAMTVLGLFWELGPMLWFGYALVSIHIIGLLIFRSALRFDLVINICYSIIVILACAVIIQLGGLSTSMGYVFIGLNCAMASVLAGNLRWTIAMFALYCSTIILIGLLDPMLETPAFLTPQHNTIYFVLDAVWVNACILFLVILFMKDKSRFEKAEAEKLRKLDEAKTQLYTNLSHEFRTPLTVILGLADQLDKNSGRSTGGPRKIKFQSRVLLRLVNQMLDIAKIEAGSMKLNLIQGDIIRYVQYITGSFQSLADQNKIKLEYQSNHQSVLADYDPQKLLQILGNLISNAIKFTDPGGKIRVSVSSNKDENSEIVSFVVRDTGKGIPSQELPHIFDRFYQVRDTLIETQGTGLGLALTRELVRMMNGSITVESTEGKGSEFTVNLPISRQALVEADHGIGLIHSESLYIAIPDKDDYKAHDTVLRGSIEKPLLLLVEDNKDVRDYLVSILEDHYLLELAENGKIGLDKALEIVPDIVLTDVMMPQMDGFELIRRLKNDIRGDHIPTIVVTAKGDFPSKMKGLGLGADHYLVKPFSEQELLLKLNNLLKARNKMQQKLLAASQLSLSGREKYKQELLFMSKINSILDEQMHDEDFGINQIASILHMSRSQLYRKFTALTNISIGRYMKSYRLQKAKIMIESRGKNVSEAAIDSGFKNLSHFSTSFSEEFGYPPSSLIKMGD